MVTKSFSKKIHRITHVMNQKIDKSTLLPACLDVVCPGAAVKRGLSGVVERVHFGAVLEENLHHVVVRLVGRQVERRQKILEVPYQ